MLLWDILLSGQFRGQKDLDEFCPLKKKISRTFQISGTLIVNIIDCTVVNVRYHCGGWSEEVNSCILISDMVYL
jgi:hypothetical protein